MPDKPTANPVARQGEIPEPVLRAVESSGILPYGIKAPDAVAAILCELAQRLSGGAARDLLAAMPRSLEVMLRPCAAHQESPEPFGRGEFLERVSGHLQIDYALAGQIAKTVFAAVREQLPPEEINHVRSQLPGGLQEFWGPPQPLGMMAGFGQTAPDAATEKILAEIESRNVLPPEISTADAAAAVMCALAQRLPGRHARDLLGQLPATLRFMLEPCALHYEQPATFSREEFFALVRQYLKIEEGRVEAVVRAVFAAVEKQLSLEEIEQVAIELPGDLKMLWGTSPSMSPADPAFEAVAADLETWGVLPPGVSAADATVAVLCVLAQRLSGGEARHLAEYVPVTIRDAMRSCAQHFEEPETFDRGEFLVRVSRELNIDLKAGEKIAKGVFAAVRKQLSPQELGHLLGQLPGDLEKLWGVFEPA